MSVWKSDEKLFIFASLISPGKILLFEKYYQAFDKVFHLVKEHAKFVENTPLRVVFSTLFSEMKHCVSCLIFYR